MQSETLSSMPFPLEAVVTTAELSERPARAPDFEAESRALGLLAQQLATAPRLVVQKLADVALEICHAHSAGISLLEDTDDGPVFRWRAVSGKFAPRLGSTVPRAASPCGTVLDRDATRLMTDPAWHFAGVDDLGSAVEEVLLVPVRVDQVPLGTIWIVAHDVTRRFDAEDARLLSSLARFAGSVCQILTSIEQLEADIAERCRGTALAMVADRDAERLICVLAHELRGPLHPIRNAAVLMKRGTLDAGTTRRTSEIIERQVHEMSRLIDELLDASRLRLGSVRLHRIRVPVSEIVERALEACAAGVAARRQALVVEAAREAIFVEADAAWLSRALQNLINNASKYTDPGGQIRVSTRGDGATVVLTVSDTGIGIDAAQLQTIFELGAQAGQAGTDRSAGGVGIGLYLARQLIESHDGTIEARSAGAGEGSELIVRMPATCAPARPTT